VVLERDFFDPRRVPDAEIPRMRSLLTIIGGQIKHDAGYFGHHKGHDDDDDD
jgi:hypothetical protein